MIKIAGGSILSYALDERGTEGTQSFTSVASLDVGEDFHAWHRTIGMYYTS